MFADDNSIENIQQLFFDFKKYLELQKKYTQLEVAEKLTILLSTLILVLLVVILGMVALFLSLLYPGLHTRPHSRRINGKFCHDKLLPYFIDCVNCCVPQKNHY